jgi:DNA-binding CsgD family transcriptional regulator
MLAVWALILVATGGSEAAEKVIADLRSQWGADVQIALAAGGAGVELAYWQGDHALAVSRAQELVRWLEELEPWLLGGLRIGALGIIAAAAQAAVARVRGDTVLEAGAVAAGEALLAHVRACAEFGSPRAGTLGPEGRAWLARAEAAASGLGGAAEPVLWERAVAAFGYGAVYEQGMSRWHHAQALLATGFEADTEAAAGELLKAFELAERLEAVPLRDVVVDLAHRARIELPGVAAAARSAVNPLTERERDVLERVALGRTNRQVGEELYISEKTVSVHLSRVMAKLGASRRAEAVAIAYDRGLLTAAS